ncbi:hypothetical protein AVEN_73121-1 [Araneus ventricosus]|uniref:Uncharacterized protein n=1 Tax=Araneus ventricosus TaxID=182803 RepID=A0A4Y2RPJ0_ARAVE|nr:hypothetical protein AVEN_73121-1 [Araneus ventricosus]
MDSPSTNLAEISTSRLFKPAIAIGNIVIGKTPNSLVRNYKDSINTEEKTGQPPHAGNKKLKTMLSTTIWEMDSPSTNLAEISTSRLFKPAIAIGNIVIGKKVKNYAIYYYLGDG